jgi:hypothetical protein
LGERGAAAVNGPLELPKTSFCGICKDRPRRWIGGRFGVEGPETAESSLLIRGAGSRKAGEGDKVGRGASERDRGFGGLFWEVRRDVGVLSPSLKSICPGPGVFCGAAIVDILEGYSRMLVLLGSRSHRVLRDIGESLTKTRKLHCSKLIHGEP